MKVQYCPTETCTDGQCPNYRPANEHHLHGGAAGSFRAEGCELCPEECQHQFGLRVDGLASCRKCGASDYDSQWGAGLFTDWPSGASKGYGR